MVHRRAYTAHRRRTVVGVLVTRRVDGRGAIGGGDGDVHRAGPRRDVTVRLVAVSALIEVPALVPKSTAVAPVKLVPLTVTEFPPAGAPLFGLTPVTVGSGL